MRKFAKIFAGIAAIATLATAGVVGFNLYRASHEPVLQANLACKTRKQLMTPFYTDWLVIHIPSTAQSCSDGDVQVVLNNGEIGNRHYREDKTLESETIWTEALKERRHIVYGADGKTVVEAREDWPDGTPAWRYSVDKNKIATSKRYWPNGKLFAEEIGTIGSNSAEVHYFYANGQAWANYVGPVNGNSNDIVVVAKKLEAWSEDGGQLLQFTSHSDGDVFKVYRADGTLWYVQSWGKPTVYSLSRLQTIEVYAADGKRLERRITVAWNGRYVEKVEDFAEDGSRKETVLDSWAWRINSITSYDKDGKEIDKTVNSTDPKPLFTMNTDILSKPTFRSPYGEWNKLVDRQIYNSSPPRR